MYTSSVHKRSCDHQEWKYVQSYWSAACRAYCSTPSIPWCTSILVIPIIYLSFKTLLNSYCHVLKPIMSLWYYNDLISDWAALTQLSVLDKLWYSKFYRIIFNHDKMTHHCVLIANLDWMIPADSGGYLGWRVHSSNRECIMLLSSHNCFTAVLNASSNVW